LACRAMPEPARRDQTGKVRVIANPYSYDDLIEAAYRHIREAASGHWQVQRHLAERMDAVLERAEDPLMRLALMDELAHLRRS
jgi:uncharacterized membrane protein